MAHFRDSGPIRGYRPGLVKPREPRSITTHAPVEPDPGWRNWAECSDEDPELFFPIGNTGPALLQLEDAKTVCKRCPVQLACLSWALDMGVEFGVFGGMSEEERRALKRRAARQNAMADENQGVQ